MPRRVQDIVQKDRRSIRDIPTVNDESESPVRAEKKQKESKIHLNRIAKSPLKNIPITPPASKKKERPINRIKWLSIAVGIIVIVAGIGYIASSYYSKASFTILPKTLSLPINGTYIAQASSSGGALAYTLVSVKASASTTVPATDGIAVSTKAQGTITLYNAYSATAVRLIAGTRMSNDSGLIYKLVSSVVIPGYTKPSGNIIPGSLKASIVADEAGQQYNISRAEQTGDLKMLGYKGSPRYDTIYGRLSTDIAGGWVGTKKSINSNLLASTSAKLKDGLIATLSAKLGGSVPEGYLLYDSGKVTSFAAPLTSGDQPKSAIVTVSGTMTGILFKKSDLIQKFSNNQSSTLFGRFGYTAPSLESIQVTVTNIKDFSPEKKGTVVLKAKGELRLVGNVPVEEIRKKLEGISLAQTQNVFREYSQVIETGQGELVPPWAKIPTDSERVAIKVIEP